MITVAPPSPATEDRSQQIIAAAFDLLEDNGLEGLTIRAVLNRTGLARRAFYERFAGKDDLVLAVFEETIRLGAEHFRAELAGVVDPLERIRQIVIALAEGRGPAVSGPGLSYNRIGIAMSREHLRLAESRPADLQAALRPLIQLIASEIADGIAAGMVRSCDPEQMATLIYNLVSTTVHAEFLSGQAHRDTERQARQAAEIWEFCRRGIAV